MLVVHCQQDLAAGLGLLRPVQVSDLCYENFIKHTHPELKGQANFIRPAQSCTEFPQGISHFLEEEK